MIVYSVPIFNILIKIFHLGNSDKCFDFISNLNLTSKARHLTKTLNELYNKVLSVKRIANFNDAFFKIKIVGNEEEITSITDCIVK